MKFKELKSGWLVGWLLRLSMLKGTISIVCLFCSYLAVEWHGDDDDDDEFTTHFIIVTHNLINWNVFVRSCSNFLHHGDYWTGFWIRIWLTNFVVVHRFRHRGSLNVSFIIHRILHVFVNVLYFFLQQVGVNTRIESVGWCMVDRLHYFLFCLPCRGDSPDCFPKNIARIWKTAKNLRSAQWRQSKVASFHQTQRDSQSFHDADEKSNILVSEPCWCIGRSHHIWLCSFSSETNRKSIFSDSSFSGTLDG